MIQLPHLQAELTAYTVNQSPKTGYLVITNLPLSHGSLGLRLLAENVVFAALAVTPVLGA